jgi:DpnII restriction endonuclease
LRLRTRHAGRTPFLLNDEYDVQDLFAALLETRFEDVRREEWGPSYAGGATRVDFLLKNESVLFETKMTREGLTDRKLGEELIIDISHYKQRLDCKALVCFAYDPEHHLKNPQALENDLSKLHGHLDVRVLIRPKS